MVELMAVLVCGGGMACSPPTEPMAIPAAASAVPESGYECRTLTFTVSGTSTVVPEYPDSSCATGLKIIPGGMTWSAASRTLGVSLRVLNQTGLDIQLPLRLELPEGGKIILMPSQGAGTNKIAALNADSTLAGNRKLWLLGSLNCSRETQVLNAR